MKKAGFSAGSGLLLLMLALSMTYAAPTQQVPSPTFDTTSIVMTATYLANIFATQDAPTPTLTMTRPPSQTPTITPLQSMTPTPTATSTLPPAIAAETATAFWQDFAPPANPTPLPASSNRERITPDNAAQVEQIGILGRGYIQDVHWTPDDQGIVVYGEETFVYNPYDFDLPPRMVTDAETLPEPLLEPKRELGTGLTRIVDTETGRERLLIQGRNRYDGAFVFFNDDYTLLAASSFSRTRVFDLRTNREIYSKNGGSHFAAFSPDSNFLAFNTVEDSGWPFVANLYVVDLRTKETITALPVNGYVNSVTFSPDNRLLGVTTFGFMAGGDDSIRIWDIATGREIQVLAKDTEEYWIIDFNSDATLLAGGSTYGRLSIWDVNTGTKIQYLERNAYTTRLLFSPNGQTVISGNSGFINIWSVESGAQKNLLMWSWDNRIEVIDFAYDSYGEVLATLNEEITEEYGTHVVLRFWEVSTGDLLFENHTIYTETDSLYFNTSKIGNQIELLNIALDGKPGNEIGVTFPINEIIIMGNQVVDIDTMRSIFTIPEVGWMSAIDLNFQNQLIATTSSSRLFLWDMRQLPFELVKVAELYKQIEYASAYYTFPVAFSPDGKLIAMGVTSKILLWDVTTGELHTMLTGHTEVVEALAFSPDGTILASGGGEAFESMSTDSVIRLWGVPNPN
jgi:WD40 repeat protein